MTRILFVSKLAMLLLIASTIRASGALNSSTFTTTQAVATPSSLTRKEMLAQKEEFHGSIHSIQFISKAESFNPSSQEMSDCADELSLQYKVPAVIIKGVMLQESHWQQFNPDGTPLISLDNGIGLMQVTVGDTNEAFQEFDLGKIIEGTPQGSNTFTTTVETVNIDIYKLKWDWRYNLEIGVRVLVAKKVAVQGAGDDASLVENWYYPLAYYNGARKDGVNDPSNPIYTRSVSSNSDWIAISKFPYQERVYNIIAQFYDPGGDYYTYFGSPIKVTLPGPAAVETGAGQYDYVNSDFAFWDWITFYSDNRAVYRKEGTSQDITYYDIVVHQVQFGDPQQFDIGDIVGVNGTDDDGLNVRENPNTSSIKLENVPDGWAFEIIDGPVSADNLRWWKVRDEKHETYKNEGWSAENWLIKAYTENLVPPELPEYFYTNQNKIEQAILWAIDQQGKTDWSEYCLKFVREAFGGELIPGWTSAEAARQQLEEESKFYSWINCWNPPRGALLFFSASGPYQSYGHIGIYLGKQGVVHAYGIVRVDTKDNDIDKGLVIVENLEYIDSYIGWAFPPEEWVQPSDVSTFTYSLSQGLNLISFPLAPTAARFSDLFAELGSDLLPYVFFMNDNGFIDYGSTQDLYAEPKKGYFLFLENPRSITVSGDSVDPGIALQRGLNMVGVTEQIVPESNSNVYPYAFFIEEGMLEYTLLFESGLQPGIGYFIFSETDENMLISSITSAKLAKVDDELVEKSVGSLARSQFAQFMTTDMEFVAEIGVEQEEAPNSVVLKFGIKPSATDGWDEGLDELRGIPMPGNLVAFFDESFGLSESYKSAGTIKEWPMVVASQSTSPGSSDNLNPVQLSWAIPAAGSIPPNTRFELLDSNGNVLIDDMTSTTSISFDVSAPSTERRYTIRMSLEESTTHTLTVASINPNSGVNITVNPNDNNGEGNGTTQFTRIYNHVTVVTLTAPSTAGGNDFQKWQCNGVDYSTNQSVTVTMDADYTMTAVYAVESPMIAYNPSSFSFSAVQGGANPDSQTLYISNSGGGTLDWTVSSSQNWLTLTPTTGTDAGSVSLLVNISGLAVDTYSAQITISATGATNSPQYVPVSLSILPSGQMDFSWQYRASMPAARYSSAIAVYDSKIHVIGGDYRLSHYRYDPGSNSWVTLESPPGGGISEGGAAVVGSKIYAVHNSLDEQMKVYNPATDRWTIGASMPTSRTGPAVVAVDGNIYTIGGWGFNTVEMYAPSTDSWITRAPMPTARGFSAAAVVNDLIYVIGGRDNGSVPEIKSTVEVYDPSTNTWTSRNSMPTRRLGPAVGVFLNKIYVMGGFDGSNYLNTVEEYDPTMDSWRTLTPILANRGHAVAGVVNSKIYIIGGRNESGALSSTEEGIPTSATVNISITPSPLDFGNVIVGQTPELGISITNQSNSTGTLNGSVGTLSSPFSVVSGSGSFSLEPGQSRSVVVRFSPTSVGTFSGTLSITHNATNQSSPTNVSINGIGIEPPTDGVWEVVGTIALSGMESVGCIAISASKAYVSRGGARMTIVDLNSGTELEDVSFSSYPTSMPRHIALLGNRAYIALSELGSDGQLAVVNTDNNTVFTYVPVGNDPWGVAAYNNRVYVTNNVWWSNGDPSTVRVVDTNTNSVIATIPVGINPNCVAVDPATGRAYVTNGNSLSKSVSVINTSTNTVIATIPMPNEPFGVAVAGSRAYVSNLVNWPNGTVEVIDMPSSSVVASIPVGRDPLGVAASSECVFAANLTSNTISVIDATTNSVIVTLDVGNSPAGVALDPATNSVYVTNSSDRTISIIRQNVTYSISGRVTFSGSGLIGVTINLTGASSATTTTDANGNYTFSGLDNASYTIAPSRSGYTFSPLSRSVTISDGDSIEQDFTVSPVINISVSSTSVNFGGVTVDQSSDLAIAITNQSSSTGTLSGNIGGLSSPFSAVSGGGSFSLSLGQSRSVVVRFSPTSAGSFSGTLSITHNATNQSSPINVSLSGKGLVPDGTDCGSDYYEDWVFYCDGDNVRKHRMFHDFYYEGGSCKDHTSWADDQWMENCNDRDDWEDTGDRRWIDDPDNVCKEKEQKKQESRDYACSGGSCSYSVSNTKWTDTGDKRNKPDGTDCGSDGWYDTEETRWIEDPDHPDSKKEQRKQEHRNHFCSEGTCVYEVADTNWIDTGWRAYTFQTTDHAVKIKMDTTWHDSPDTFKWEDDTDHGIKVLFVQNISTDSRYKFSNWSGKSTSTDTVISIHTSAEAAGTYIANYKTQYYLTVETDPSGIDTTLQREGWYDGASLAEIGEASSQFTRDGITYCFAGWTVNDTPISDNPLTLTMDSPRTAIAHYEILLTVPPIVDMPDTISFQQDSFYTVNLDTCVSDRDHLDSEISWSYSGNVHVRITLDPATRIATFTSEPDWYGEESIIFTATDPEGARGKDTFIVSVFNVPEPPSNLQAFDTPNDQGHSITLTWMKSPDDGAGLNNVSYYRIYRSRSSELTDPIPISVFPWSACPDTFEFSPGSCSGLDSLMAMEVNHTILIDSVVAGITEYVDFFVPVNGVDYTYWLDAVAANGAVTAKVLARFVSTAVDEEVTASLPQGYFLFQNCPNPFNASTIIRVRLPESSEVRLSVYTLLGQEVRRLVEEKMAAGTHSVRWDGRDDSGKPLASGVYLCRFRAGDFTQTKRIVLLR